MTLANMAIEREVVAVR